LLTISKFLISLLTISSACVIICSEYLRIFESTAVLESLYDIIPIIARGIIDNKTKAINSLIRILVFLIIQMKEFEMLFKILNTYLQKI